MLNFIQIVRLAVCVKVSRFYVYLMCQEYFSSSQNEIFIQIFQFYFFVFFHTLIIVPLECLHNRYYIVESKLKSWQYFVFVSRYLLHIDNFYDFFFILTKLQNIRKYIFVIKTSFSVKYIFLFPSTMKTRESFRAFKFG